MSKDKFYIKDLQPIRKFCLDSDKEDVYKYIYSLQQENQQLKNKLNMQEMLCFNMHEKTEIVCLTKASYERNKTSYETLDLYKSVIDEVREFIKEKYEEDYSKNDNYIPIENLNLKNCSYERSLQVLEILDKVKKSE